MKKHKMSELTSNLLADQRLPRRQFVQTSGGLFLAVSAPLLIRIATGCTEETLKIGIALLVTALQSYLKNQNIGGDVAFKNDSNAPTGFQGTYSLLLSRGMIDTGSRKTETYDVPPGQTAYLWDGISASSSGEHLVRLAIPYVEMDTPTFNVT